MIWYSLSVRVSAGATVMESPVCTPIGSRFSIEQTMMQLSLLIADNLHLVFLPAQHAFLDQDFAGRGGVEAALADLDEFALVVGDAAARAAHGEGGADDRGQADIVQRGQGLAEILDMVRARRVEADLGHRLAEQLAVLGLVDRLGGGADHLDVELLQHADLVAGAVGQRLLVERERAVQRRLATHGRQQGEAAGEHTALLLDDLRDDLGRDRLDIGRVGQIRVGHDRGRVRVDQHDAVALGLQRLHRLGAGIVELAGLADDDGAGADDQDRLDVCALGHEARLLRPGTGARALVAVRSCERAGASA